MRYYILFIVGFAVGLTACKTDALNPGLSAGIMTAEINGAYFEATGVLATRNPGSSGVGEGYTISGNGNAGFPSITLTLFSSSKGNYNLGVSGTGNTSATFSTSSTNQAVSSSGSISITMIEYLNGGEVRGTFSFVADNITISNGTFQARFAN